MSYRPEDGRGHKRRIIAHLDKLQAHVDRLKRCQARTAEELDAPLPAVLERGFHP